MPHNRQVHQAKKRNGDVADNGRQRDLQYLTVNYMHALIIL
jgi:hypothetical protein